MIRLFRIESIQPLCRIMAKHQKCIRQILHKITSASSIAKYSRISREFFSGAMLCPQSVPTGGIYYRTMRVHPPGPPPITIRSKTADIGSPPINILILIITVFALIFNRNSSNFSLSEILCQKRKKVLDFSISRGYNKHVLFELPV